jgi:hypothetical protein
VNDMLFPADRDGGNVAESGIAELCRSGREVMVALLLQVDGPGPRGVGCVSRCVTVQSEDMIWVYCRGCLR